MSCCSFASVLFPPLLLTVTHPPTTVIASLTTQRNAIKMLFDRVSIIVVYLAAVSAGTAPKDEETLRQISSLVAGLKQGRDGNAESGEWREEFMTVSSTHA